LYSNTTGSYSTGLGSYTLEKSTAGENTAVGYSSLWQNETGT
jgi:hypothetical protein